MYRASVLKKREETRQRNDFPSVAWKVDPHVREARLCFMKDVCSVADAPFLSFFFLMFQISVESQKPSVRSILSLYISDAGIILID